MPSPSSNSALRYTTGVHAPPATERQTTSASWVQPPTAARIRKKTETPPENSTLAMAVSHTATPSRAPVPELVSRLSADGTSQATVTEYSSTTSAAAISPAL